MNILIAILIFSVIILFHELGHFSLAKANGIKVNEFSLGLGPTLFGIQGKETKYSLKLLPFGGMCAMEGEDEESADQRAFQNKSVWARISVVAAGPIFNFIMAFILSIIVIGLAGFDKPEIGSVMDGYAAQEAGLKQGDVILQMNHKSIHFYREVSFFTFVNENEPVKVSYERDGKKYQTTLTPTYSKEEKRYLLGLFGTGKRERTDILETVKYSALEVKYWIDTTFTSLKLLVTGRVSLNDLSGPVGIVKTIGTAYNNSKTDGSFYVFLNMMNMCILLSANLGVMNLLPLPALDGGRLVFLFLEAIRRKRIDPNKEGMVHTIGLLLLLGLMVIVLFNDIRKLFI